MKKVTSFKKRLIINSIIASIIPMLILGAISLYLYSSSINHNVYSGGGTIIILYITVIMASIFSSTILTKENSRYLANMVENLSKETAKISDGNYNLEMRHSDIEEFEILTNGIVKMAKDIKERENAITELNRSLENMVEERTNQLVSVNIKLGQTNAMLEEEIDEKTALEEELRAINEELEDMVDKRTSQLIESNIELIQINAILEEEIDEKTKAKDELNESEKKFRLAIEDSPVPVMLHAEDGEVLALSSAWTEITGYSIKEIPQIQIWTEKAYGEMASEVNQSNVSLFSLKERVYEGEFEIITSSGEMRTWGFYSTLIGKLSDDRKIVMSVGVDLTDQKQFEYELLNAKEKAEDANNSKDDFLANMSHEIRTPMNGIIGMLEVLNMTSLSEEQSEYLDVIKSSSKFLLNILNDILDYSKIEAGKIELAENSFNIRNLLSNMISLFRESIHKTNLELHYNIDNNIPDLVLGDNTKLQQVLANLIGNAIKFTDKGEINVDVSLMDSNDDYVNIEITVSDTGVGIKKIALENIFDRFIQLDKPGRRKSRGTGLGLSISKALTEKMGGGLTVESEFGVGSCFKFDLKLNVAKKCTVDERACLEINEVINTENAMELLVVEDDTVSAQMLEILLGKKGYKVSVANSGEVAVSMYKDYEYDLVLMDVNLPGMNGFETTKVIKKIDEAKNKFIPVIAMTANALAGDREKCINAGMDDYLTKPIDVTAVINKISSYDIYDNYTGQNIIEIKEINHRDSVLEMCIQKLVKATEFEEEVALELITEYTNYAEVLIKDIEAGIKAKSYDSVKGLLHQLKGSSGNMRVEKIHELTKKGELILQNADISRLNEIMYDINEIVTSMKKELVTKTSIS